MKKKVLVILGVIILLIGGLVGLYFYGLSPVSKSSKNIEFTIKEGTKKVDIVNNLKEADLVKSKLSLLIYLGLNRNINLQAGVYNLNKAMGAREIIQKIGRGDIKQEDNTYKIVFIEGKRLTEYASKIAKATNESEEDVIAILNDREFLESLIEKYWFLTEDILKDGIYYPLEGYLFASTYELYNNSNTKDIVIKMLDGLDSILEPLKEEIENSKYSIHEILTLASIVEVEGANSNDRAGVAGVFFNRLSIGDSLGSDMTTYYAAKKDFREEDLSQAEIDNCNNGYNTRTPCNVGKIPIGPICSPSLESIKAVLNPTEHDYFFFVADKNANTYFTKTYSEHVAKKRELVQAGLYYEY